MPKIENWSRVSDDHWEHDKIDADLKIMEDSGIDSEYDYLISIVSSEGIHDTRKGDETEQVLRGFDTKEEARERAREWMKDHPLEPGLSIEEVEEAIRPIAQEKMQAIKESMEEAGWDTSEIAETSWLAGGKRWEMNVDTNGEVTSNDGESEFGVSFAILDSQEYEGEFMGYNVELKAVFHGGQIIGSVAPYNYTEKVWTNELSELKKRARNIEVFNADDIKTMV